MSRSDRDRVLHRLVAQLSTEPQSDRDAVLRALSPDRREAVRAVLEKLPVRDGEMSTEGLSLWLSDRLMNGSRSLTPYAIEALRQAARVTASGGSTMSARRSPSLLALITSKLRLRAPL